MTVRLKILALSATLLAILCSALFVSLRLQHEVHEEIATITEYHLPLTALLVDTEAAMLAYQLNLVRATAKVDEPGVAETVRKRERETAARLNGHLDDVEAMIARAVRDPRNNPGVVGSEEA